MQPQTAGALPVLPTITRAEAEAKLTDEVFADMGDDTSVTGALTPDAYWEAYRQAILTALFGPET